MIVASLHDAHDLKEILTLRLRQLQAFAERTLVRPNLRSHGVIDDGDGSGAITIVGGEIASRDERNTQGREVVEIDGIHDRGEGIGFFALFLALDDEASQWSSVGYAFEVLRTG